LKLSQQDPPTLKTDSSPQPDKIDLFQTLTSRQLNRQEETALFHDLRSLYKEALFELAHAPRILATLPRLAEVVNEHRVSLSLLMNRGELNAFQLREKYNQSFDEAQRYHDAEKSPSDQSVEMEVALFNNFDFSTAVVDIIGPHYCSMQKCGALGDSARESGEKIEDILTRIQPLKEKLFE
jgi:hypothetical protein